MFNLIPLLFKWENNPTEGKQSPQGHMWELGNLPESPLSFIYDLWETPVPVTAPERPCQNPTETQPSMRLATPLEPRWWFGKVQMYISELWMK